MEGLNLGAVEIKGLEILVTDHTSRQQVAVRPAWGSAPAPGQGTRGVTGKAVDTMVAGGIVVIPRAPGPEAEPLRRQADGVLLVTLDNLEVAVEEQLRS